MSLPTFSIPFIAACRINYRFLLESLDRAALTYPENASRILAIKAICEDISTPTNSAVDSEPYAEKILALLASPKAALATHEELENLVSFVVADARGFLAETANSFATIANTSYTVSL